MALGKRQFLAGIICGLTAGCVGTWTTDYSDAISPAVSRGWRVSAINVTVPDNLTVSEENVYAPVADIVWRGDAPGDRRAQVAAIFERAAWQGAAGLRGPRAVRLSVDVTRFHALSDTARLRLTRSGVHDIAFVARITDARTNEVLADPEAIRADIIAYTGEDALAAEREGQTQKVRITNHLTRVFAGWLGAGPDDVRGSFQRIGR
ncbi:MAG: DUF6778 family protein [Rhodovulum sp.]